MKKNFAGLPNIQINPANSAQTTLTGYDIYTELNPNILNSEDIFKPNPLQNFTSDSPKRGNYRCFEDDYNQQTRSRGGNWLSTGLDILKAGAGIWSQQQTAKSAEEIARLQLEKERLEAEQQQQKSQTFRKYGVPIIITSVVLVAGITTFLILRKK